jgi:hypothetical protein
MVVRTFCVFCSLLVHSSGPSYRRSEGLFALVLGLLVRGALAAGVDVGGVAVG